MQVADLRLPRKSPIPTSRSTGIESKLMSSQPEVWLRGPVSGVSPRLQPAAHALLQTVEDVEQAVEGLNADQLWTAPGGAASVGFHLLHLAGATNRLLTYARGETLNDAQRARLQAKGILHARMCNRCSPI